MKYIGLLNNYNGGVIVHFVRDAIKNQRTRVKSGQPWQDVPLLNVFTKIG